MGLACANAFHTVCPYLVFAARTPASQHADAEFIVGNIFTDADIAQRLDDYRFHDRYQVGANATCGSCSMNSGCGKVAPPLWSPLVAGLVTSTPSSARSPTAWPPENVGCCR